MASTLKSPSVRVLGWGTWRVNDPSGRLVTGPAIGAASWSPLTVEQLDGHPRIRHADEPGIGDGRDVVAHCARIVGGIIARVGVTGGAGL